MAGAGLLEIKRRIRSIRNTQKITKAMGLVATVKVRKLKERSDSSNPFYEVFNEAIKNIALSIDLNDSIYFRQNNSDTDVYIVITSDSGLCGSYNANVINKALEHMYGKKVLLITVGERGKSFFTRNKYETLAEFVEVGDTPSLKDAQEILRPALEVYREGKVRNIYIVYTRFYSPVKQEVEVLKLLPVERPGETSRSEMEFDPSPDSVLDYAIPSFLRAAVFNALTNSTTSEYSIRMTAMDAATKNAGDILDKLNLEYNRARQSSITQEITEIVSGAEALKD
ncbi:ATP synthase F1 subunit gamma [Fonticella tunisiensis]|uniref:ATP synthase gamma chain n=1 Tax=Fonticella tunisiensis TaxID=1096341 RepID=A0A4R7KVI6_9CLOT|nr:ATP synthase F1 subunit gamma [Fonticella tunisiensis]TDT62393.1 F-type H+-transporting ATPase subunit gamma [Fonticella tunisiensis]